MRIIFSGTPNFAAHCLDALVHSQHTICAVLTQPDKPVGRGQHIQESPVKQMAQSFHLPIYQPKHIKEEGLKEKLLSFKADVLINVAYAFLFTSELLNLFPFGCLNVHPSLLPRWRGASPVQSAILAGDEVTGVSIMKMDEGLDTGPVFLQESCTIDPLQTAGELAEKLQTLSIKLLLETLSQLETGRAQSKPQDKESVCYTKKIHKEDARLLWKKDALTLQREVLAFNPWPVSYAKIDDLFVRIWRAITIEKKLHAPPGKIVQLSSEGIDVMTGKGVLRIKQMQFPGRKILDVMQTLNSKREFLLEHDSFE
jgi:methionyl-tRNA formyltransferase